MERVSAGMEEQRGQSEDDCAPPHTNTSFFIDNILRPDFGCRLARGAADRRARCPDSRSRSDGASSSASSTVSSPASCARPKGEEADGGDAGAFGLASASPAARNGPAERASPGKDAPWPAWVYCTRYSDRPSSGPRTRRLKQSKSAAEDKRGRTAFTAEQLQRLRAEFLQSRYIAEQRRRALARELGLNEAQVKIWFQNKRAKIKKSSGSRDGLAKQLMAQGLYNHSTTTVPEQH